jgi:hypothetical protein
MHIGSTQPLYSFFSYFIVPITCNLPGWKKGHMDSHGPLQLI